MKKHYLVAGLLVAILLAVVGGFLSLFYGSSPEYLQRVPTAPVEVPTQASLGQAIFAVADPEQAPPPLHDLVVEGYYILMDTPMHAPRYVGQWTRVSCRNCHFEAGRARETVSLVGAATQYPRPVPGSDRVISLAQRVQMCFVNNLGGTPPPLDSRVMQAVEAYLHWISNGMPIYGHVDWLGLPALDLPGEPSVASGTQVYTGVCSRCHGAQGQGGGLAPPLWGSGSFTTGSSMAQQPILASFVHRFMPFKKPALEPRQASDVAAFVLSRPRQEPGVRVPALTREPVTAEPAVQGLEAPPAMPYDVPLSARGDAEQQLQAIARRMAQQGVASMPATRPTTTQAATLPPRTPPATRPALATQPTTRPATQPETQPATQTAPSE